eukprot:1158482-Prorocentrum_minimum.AAC.1
MTNDGSCCYSAPCSAVVDGRLMAPPRNAMADDGGRTCGPARTFLTVGLVGEPRLGTGDGRRSLNMRLTVLSLVEENSREPPTDESTVWGRWIRTPTRGGESDEWGR